MGMRMASERMRMAKLELLLSCKPGTYLAVSTSQSRTSPPLRHAVLMTPSCTLMHRSKREERREQREERREKREEGRKKKEQRTEKREQRTENREQHRTEQNKKKSEEKTEDRRQKKNKKEWGRAVSSSRELLGLQQRGLREARVLK
jgi:hypothetical protein